MAVFYTTNSEARPLKAGVMLSPGTVILTSQDSEAYVSVNGIASTIKISAASELDLDEMISVGFGIKRHTETVLNLRKGSLMGDVKKLAGNSTYQIRTPNGVASATRTHEAIFQVKIEPGKDGAPKTTFLCGEGNLQVATEGPGKSNVVEMAAAEVCVSESGILKRTLALPEHVAVLMAQFTFDGGGVRPPEPPPPAPIIPPFNGNGPPRLITVPTAPTR